MRIESNPEILATIKACQAAANTTFCWPPDGARICVPAYSIPFYWPQAYYNATSKVAIEYDLASNLLLLLNNTGNRTEAFTSFMFERKALPISGTQNEKSMKLYMRERRINDQSDPLNLKVHDGPTLTLVKTADFTSRTSARATSSGTSYRTSLNDNDHSDRLAQGAIAGIIIGALLGFVILILFCCYGCCSGKGRRAAKPKISHEEHARIIAQGTELMAQRGTMGEGQKEPGAHTRLLTSGTEGARWSGERDAARAEEARAGDFGAPPPKYTP